MRFAVRFAALLLLALAVAPAARAAVTPGLNIDFQPGADPAYVESQLDLAKRVHARDVRIEIAWSALEPDAAGTRDAAYLAVIDHAMSEASRRGLRVIAVVDGSPCWATTAPDDRKQGCAPAGADRWSTYPPSEPADYAAICAFLAQRYADQLAAIELWNEPDHEQQLYFGGPDKPARYAALVKAAYPAIKRVAPSVPVLAGSLVGANGTFLKALYAEGIKGSYDGLAVHYYDLVLASLRSIRDTQRANGDRTPVWLTEFGWTSCSPRRTQGGHACVTSTAQAANLVQTYRALRRASWVRVAAIYTIQDSRQYQFGLLDIAGKPKPAIGVLQRALGRPLPGPSRPKLRLRRSGGRLVASGSGPAGDALELDAYRGGGLAYKATFTLDRRNRFSLRLPAALGTSGIRVRVYQYWSGVSAGKTS